MVRGMARRCEHGISGHSLGGSLREVDQRVRVGYSRCFSEAFT